MESAIVPGIYDPTLADEDLRVGSERAYEMVRRLAREEGLLAGISSGAALAAMLDVAKRLDRGVIVTVFPDGAEKYLNETFWTAERCDHRRSVTAGVAAGDPASRRGDVSARVLRRAGRPRGIVTGRRGAARTRPRKVRGAGFSCGRRTTGWRNSGAASWAASCSGSIIRIRITRRGRRSTISITRGRPLRT